MGFNFNNYASPAAQPWIAEQGSALPISSDLLGSRPVQLLLMLANFVPRPALRLFNHGKFDSGG